MVDTCSLGRSRTAEVTHHMDPVIHVPPEDFGYQHFASEATGSNRFSEVQCSHFFASNCLFLFSTTDSIETN